MKKRLLGAAVLVSLAVIFVPMLIDESGTSTPPMQAIPPAPPVPATPNLFAHDVLPPAPMPKPAPAVVQTQETPAASPGPAATPAATAAKTPVTQTSSPPPASRPAAVATSAPAANLVAWVVQVGSFSQRENALQLVARLRKAGLQTPDPDRVTVNGKPMYRVRVGPMVEKSQAQALLPKVNKISGTKGAILRFE